MLCTASSVCVSLLAYITWPPKWKSKGSLIQHVLQKVTFSSMYYGVFIFVTATLFYVLLIIFIYILSCYLDILNYKRGPAKRLVP